MFKKLISMQIISVIFCSIVNASNLQFAVFGDAGRDNSEAALLRKSVKSLNVMKLIMPGDNLYAGTYDSVWSSWKKDGFIFENVAIGNHTDGYAKEVAFFKMPGEYFSKTYLDGIIQYITLNSDNTKTVDEQMLFLENELKKSTANQIYLMYHHPSLTVASHEWTEKRNFQTKIRTIIKKYRSKISALVVGHDHIASLMHFDDVPVIISGCTQNPRRETPVNDTQEGIKVTTQIHYGQQPYWFIQDVFSNYSEFKLIRAKDNKEMCLVTIQTGKPATYKCN